MSSSYHPLSTDTSTTVTYIDEPSIESNSSMASPVHYSQGETASTNSIAEDDAPTPEQQQKSAMVEEIINRLLADANVTYPNTNNTPDSTVSENNQPLENTVDNITPVSDSSEIVTPATVTDSVAQVIETTNETIHTENLATNTAVDTAALDMSPAPVSPVLENEETPVATETQMTTAPLVVAEAKTEEKAQAVETVVDSVESTAPFSHLTSNSLKNTMTEEALTPVTSNISNATAAPANPAWEEFKDDLTAKKPGEKLRLIREHKNITIEQISDRLRLNLSLIRALEADNYGSLPPAVFVRGYIRSYARLLEIPEEPLLESFGHYDSATLPPITVQGERNKPQTTSNDSWFKVFSFIIIIGLLVLMAMYRFGSETTTHTPLLLPPPAENAGNSENAPPPNALPLDARPLSAPAPSMGTPAPTAGTPAAPMTAPAATEVVAETKPVETPAPVVDNNSISVTVKVDMSITVTDKDNKKLYNGVAKANEKMELKGTPPFKIRAAGSPEAVDVDYQGKTANLGTFEKVANFRKTFLVQPTAETKPTTTTTPH